MKMRAIKHISLVSAYVAVCVVFFFVGFYVSPIPEAGAQGLSISPNRVIFSARKSKDRVLVSNPGEKKRSYRVALLNRRMLETGKYVDVKEGEELEDELFANKLVRFSPRSFSLEPRTAQTIRLRLRKPKDLPDGEYRSHLRVQVLPEAGTPSIIESGKVGIKIRVNYGITIPIIVRKGDLDYNVTVNSIELNKDPQSGRDIIRAVLGRTGSRSSYGDISVVYRDTAGKEHLLKFLPGLSLFYPNNKRIFNIPLDVPQGLSLSGGIIRVIYREQEAEGGAIIAEGSQTI